MKDLEKISLQKADEKHPIFRLIVANTCNLTCPYCHVFQESKHYQTGKVNLMDSSLAIESIERFKKYLDTTHGKPPIISFYGGEALLNRKVILDVYHHFGLWPVGYIINTNGTPLHRSLLIPLPKEKAEYHISLDGAADQNDKTRRFRSGQGVFKKVAQNILNMQEGEFSIQINFMITLENIHYLSDFVETLNHLKVKRLYCDITREVYEQFEPEVLAEILLYFFAKCSASDIATSGPWKVIFKTVNDFLVDENSFYDSTELHPLAPELNLEVHPDGKVYSPHYYPQESIGNFKDLENIERTPGYQKALQGLNHLIKECTQCPLKHRCAGSLKYVWQYHYETTQGSNRVCDTFRLIAEEAMRSIAKKRATKNEASQASFLL